MKADAHLPVWVRDLPAAFVFQPDGQLRMSIADWCKMGVVKVVAGPVAVHVRIEIKRPYFRPRPGLPSPLPAIGP